MPRYTDEQIITAVKSSNSIAAVCRHLGIKPMTGSQTNISRRIKRLGVETTHFSGNKWMRSVDNIKLRRPIDTYLVKGSTIHSSKLLNKLLVCGLKDNACEVCNANNWNDTPLSLELHHKDCDHFNNELNNLMVLCPNCHQVEHTTLKLKIHNKQPKMISKVDKFCPQCGKKISTKSKTCLDCYSKNSIGRVGKKKIEWPTKEYLEAYLKTNSCLALSKELGVSGNAIAKHCKKLGLIMPVRGHWAKVRADK